MQNFRCEVPVALLIFNRADTTERVFEAVRQAKPAKLLVVADGARPDRPGEAEKCAAARAVFDRVDWDCEVLTNYSEVNLGCKMRVSTGLDWVFETVETAIILEDDCVPDPTFFQFCQVLLDKYRDDERVMMIAGTNMVQSWKADHQSYHFSYYGGIWGWASWRRAWQHYDIQMNLWGNSECRDRVRDVLADDKQFEICSRIFEAAYKDRVDVWAARWLFARMSQSGLSIVPAVNLIENIGFRPDATHTKSDKVDSAKLKAVPCQLPIEFTPFTAVDRGYDREFAARLPQGKTKLGELKQKLKKLLKGKK